MPQGKLRRLLRTGTIAASALCLEQTVHAEPAVYNISAGSGENAILAFGQQSGLQVVIASEDLKGRKLNAVKGIYEPLEALNRLIKGSGLRVLSNDGRTVVLAPRRTSPAERPKAANTTAPKTADVMGPPADVGEIVVTAQFRATNLQDTPLAISALSGKAIQDRGYTDVTQVANSAPSVNLTPGGGVIGRTVSAFIRGVGAFEVNPAVDPSVGFYIDDIYHASLAGASFDLLDLQRVEVLRGPQGTLFGKNTIGGAIRLISKKPEFDAVSGSIEATAGSYDRFDVRASINLPLASHLAVRLSAVHKQRDGYVDRVDFACANPALAGSLVPRVTTSSCKLGTEGGENVDAFRIAVRAAPSDRLEVNLTGDYSDDRSEAPPNVVKSIGGFGFDPAIGFIPFLNVLYSGQINPAIQVAPGVPLNPAMFGIGPNGLFGVAYDQRFLPPNPFVTYSSYDNRVPAQYAGLFGGAGTALAPTAGNRSWGLSGSLDYELSDAIKLRSISGYRKLKTQFSLDFDGSPLPLAGQDNRIASRQFSQEFQAIGKTADGALDWVVGLYYFKGKAGYRVDVDFPVAGLGYGSADSSINDFGISDKSAFVHVTCHLTDRLNLIGGLRYTRERKTFFIDSTFYRPPFLGGVSTIAVHPPALKYEDWSPKVSLDYKLADDIMAYGQFSSGFRGGGFNNRAFDARQVFPIGPEKLKAVEAGLKTQFFDRRITANIALFRSKYSDMQTFVGGFDLAVGGQFNSILNVGGSTVKGIEGEFSARPADGLDLYVVASLLDAQLTRLGDAGGLALNPATLPAIGSRLIGASEHKVTAGGQYRTDVGEVGALTAQAEMTYTSAIYYNATNTPLSREPGFIVVNASLSLAFSEKIEAVLRVTNLFDRFYYQSNADGASTGFGAAMGNPGRPREWALTLRRTF